MQHEHGALPLALMEGGPLPFVHVSDRMLHPKLLVGEDAALRVALHLPIRDTLRLEELVRRHRGSTAAREGRRAPLGMGGHEAPQAHFTAARLREVGDGLGTFGARGAIVDGRAVGASGDASWSVSARAAVEARSLGGHSAAGTARPTTGPATRR